MKLSYEALHEDPELLARLLEQARRERSQAVHEILIAPIVNLFRAAKASRGAASPSAC